MNTSGKLLAVLFFIAAVVLGILAWRTLPYYFPKTVSVTNDEPSKPSVRPDDPILGSPSAAKTIIEFGDAECPYCSQISSGLEQFVRANPKVRLVWKDCPLPQHPNAQQAAEAAHCAGDQGKFWEFHDLLMQNSVSLNPSLYSHLADELKLDTKRFGDCLISGQKTARVLGSLSECATAGANELPWFYVDGKTYSGAGALDSILNDPELK